MGKSARKFNEKTKEYERFLLPDKASAFETDMNTLVQCAECKKEIDFGNGFSSQTIHDALGSGYCVCLDCHDEELKNRSKFNSEV